MLVTVELSYLEMARPDVVSRPISALVPCSCVIRSVRISFLVPKRPQNRSMRPTAVHDLPPFPVNTSSSTVELPGELRNEPFAYQDNRLRPSIIQSRPRFLFQIHDDGVATADIRNQYVESPDSDIPLYIPERRSTTTSVASIYDTYGLAVTLTFLEYIYYNKQEECSEWLEVYIKGSILVINHEFYQWLRDQTPMPLYLLFALLILQLQEIDQRQPRMRDELVTVQQELPPELLAKIIGRSGVSKEVSNNLRASRCGTVPSLDDVWRMVDVNGGLDAPHTVRAENGDLVLTYGDGQSMGRGLHQLRWSRTGDGSHLEHIDEDLDSDATEIVAFSLYDYANYFDLKGCQVMKSMETMLRDLGMKYAEIDPEREEEAAAWLVQLSYDLTEMDDVTFETTDDMRDELQRLIELAIIQDSW